MSTLTTSSTYVSSPYESLPLITTLENAGEGLGLGVTKRERDTGVSLREEACLWSARIVEERRREELSRCDRVGTGASAA